MQTSTTVRADADLGSVWPLCNAKHEEGWPKPLQTIRSVYLLTSLFLGIDVPSASPSTLSALHLGFFARIGKERNGTFA